MKGTIFGAIGARLGTATRVGLLTLDLRRGGILRRNVDVAHLTTFSSALWLAVLAKLASRRLRRSPRCRSATSPRLGVRRRC